MTLSFRGGEQAVFVFVLLKLVERLYCWFIFFSETCDYLLISFHCGAGMPELRSRQIGSGGCKMWEIKW